MAKKKKKKLTKKDMLKMDKGIHRAIMVKEGIYNLHRNKKHKDKSKYSRKKKNVDDDDV